MEAWCVVEHEKPLQKISLPKPEPTGTEVLIKVTHAGVCHSDIHFWEGYYDLGGGKIFRVADRGATLPQALGHEILGVVEKLGPEAEGQDVAVGDRRTIYPWVGCGACTRCERGEDNMCLNQRSLGVRSHGGFASHVIVPHPKYLVDYGDCDPAVACTFGCSGITTYSAVSKAMPLEPDEAIVLIGAGGLGLAAISMLHAMGHRKIISLDIDAGKREGALKAGATAVVDSSGVDAAKDVVAAAGGPVPAVLDFVNNSKTSMLGFTVLAKGGKLIQVGIMGGELPLSLATMIFKGLTIAANLTGNPQHLREVVTLARAGKLAPIPTTTVPWDQADDALNQLRAGKVNGRLILVHP